MNAIVSGRSGRALIIEGEALKSVEIDEPSTLVPRKRSDLPYLFGDAADLRIVENTTTESVINLLNAESNFTLALDLTLISLDAELEIDIRREALEGLEELFADGNTLERVERVMYSHPIPDDGDLDGALDICTSELKVVSEFLRTLKSRQPSITEVDDAWAAIPTKSFDGDENRKVFRRTAVEEGLFHVLATTDSPASLLSLQLKAGLNRSIQRLPNCRQVIEAWVAPLRKSGEEPKIMEKEDGYRRGLLYQLIQQEDNRISQLQMERESLVTKRATTLAEFQALSDIHDVPDRTLPGFESITRPYETQMATARRYRGFAIVSALAAIVFGIYFSVNTLVSSSVPALIAGSFIITVALGWLATGLLTVITRAHPRNPAAEATLNKVVYVSGALLFLALLVFGILRFLTDIDSSIALPFLMVGIELTLIICAGALESCRNLFVWSGELDNRFHELSNLEAELAAKLESETRVLVELKERLNKLTTMPVNNPNETKRKPTTSSRLGRDVA
jgi:hypothetical protein